MDKMKYAGLPALCLTVLLALCLALPAAAGSVGKYGMLPVYGRDVADGTYPVDVESACEQFQAVAAKLTADGGVLSAELTLSGTDCIGLFLGSGGGGRPGRAHAVDRHTGDGAGKYCLHPPVDALDRAVPCAFYSAAEEAWVDNWLLFDASALPREALLIELPDYDLIERALDSLTGSSAGTEERVTAPVEAAAVDLADGEYAVSVDLIGGSGKASVVTPTVMTVRDGRAYATIEWSSANYDYMVVGTQTYYNTSPPEVNSVFEIPIGCWDEEMPVIGDTTAMGTPHEVGYTLTFYKDSIAGKSTLPREAAKRVVCVAVVIIVGGGVLNHYVKKKRRA